MKETNDVSMLGNDRFAALTGLELLEVKPGYAKVKLVIDPEKHLNHHGWVHGGAIFTLADYAFAAAANAHGIPATGINVHIQYMKATQGGVLYAEATENACTRKIASYTVWVTDESGERKALFQGMAYRKG